jgi:hypothetical protein
LLESRTGSPKSGPSPWLSAEARRYAGLSLLSL